MSRRWIRLLFAGAALLMLGFRFWRLGDAPFVQDEPFFLSSAREQLYTGHWAQVSPILGSQPFRYGPSVQWFYGVVQWLFGPHPQTAIAAMCGAMCLAHVALAAGLAHLFGGGLLLFATLLAFLASSPFQFIWSRLAWDQLVNVGVAWAVFLLCARERLRLRRLFPLGLVLGVAVSSHPMVLPFVVFTAVVIAIDTWREPRRLGLSLATVGLGILIVNLPYLRHLIREPPGIRPSSGFSLSVLRDQLLQPVRVATFAGIEYFFDRDWIGLVHWLGGWFSLYPASVVVTLLAMASALGLALSLRSQVVAQRRIALLAGACWIAYAAVYASRGLSPHPHHEFPVYWVIVAGLASLVTWLTGKKAPYGNLACAIVLILSWAQFALLAAVAQFLHLRDGTRGVHYSTSVAKQEEVVRAACLQPEQTVVLQNMTILFPASLKYLASTMPECRGKALQICPPECLTPSTHFSVLGLQYAKPQGGGVTVVSGTSGGSGLSP